MLLCFHEFAFNDVQKKGKAVKVLHVEVIGHLIFPFWILKFFIYVCDLLHEIIIIWAENLFKVQSFNFISLYYNEINNVQFLFITYDMIVVLFEIQ